MTQATADNAGTPRFCDDASTQRGALFHIADEASWNIERDASTYVSADFVRERFIHLSTSAQVAATAARYYSGRTDVCLLEIDIALVESKLRWENLVGGDELFPHLYAPLPRAAVVAEYALSWLGGKVQFIASAG